MVTCRSFLLSVETRSPVHFSVIIPSDFYSIPTSNNRPWALLLNYTRNPSHLLQIWLNMLGLTLNRIWCRFIIFTRLLAHHAVFLSCAMLRYFGIGLNRKGQSSGTMMIHWNASHVTISNIRHTYFVSFSRSLIATPGYLVLLVTHDAAMRSANARSERRI